MIKRRKKRAQEQERQEKEEQEHNEIKQYQKIINKICSQLETHRLYQCTTEAILHSAEVLVACAITTIIDLAKPKF